MTALMQEVMERVQALPKNKQDYVLPKLLAVLSDDEPQTEREITAYIDDDLTGEERAIMRKAREKRSQRTEDYIPLDEALANLGIAQADLEKIPPIKFVYKPMSLKH